MRIPLLTVASLFAFACSSESSPPSIKYGLATVEPSTVTLGDSILVTPAAEIQPICGDFAVVFRSVDGVLEPVIQLLHDGWVSFGATQPTWPACLPPRSSASVEFLIADDFPGGTYVVCLSHDLTQDACGPLTVVAP